MSGFSAKRSTKFVPVRIKMISGQLIEGEFHVSASTSSSVRPSDAIADTKDFIKVISPKITENDGREERRYMIQVAKTAIAWIEHAETNDRWQSGRDHQRPEHVALSAD